MAGPARYAYDDRLAVDHIDDDSAFNHHDIYDKSGVYGDASIVTERNPGVPAQEPSVGVPNVFGQTPAESVAERYLSTVSHDVSQSSSRASYGENTFFPTAGGRSYVDEDLNQSSSHPDQKLDPGPEASDVSLVHNAADLGRSSKFQDLEYADPYDDNDAKPLQEKASPLSRFMASGKYPLEQRIEDKKRGIGRQKYPFAVWILTVIMIAVFIKELVLNGQEQGTPVSFKPVVNPMLGPSESALINLGARFPPCMKSVQGAPPNTQMACLNDTANPPDRVCPLEVVCGFGGFHDQTPNQWFRFITPVFLHAGFIHIALNMLAQLTVSAQIEREMGSGGFIILYLAAGIFGNVLGGNFALVGAPSLGASGAIFGTVAVTWVDLFAHWKYQYRPVRKLAFMTIELIVGIAMGYIPYVDNFAHLGGLFMGLLVGTTLYPVISISKRHKAIMWGFRLAAIPVAVILYVVLIRNFYTSDPYAACSGCRYLSCFPTASNNHCQGTGFTTTSGSSI